MFVLIWATLLFSVKAESNSNTTDGVTVNLTNVTETVTGTPAVKKDDASNLTCTVEGFYIFNLTWTKLGCNKNLQKECPQNDAGKATLVVRNVTKEHSGHYVCTAEHQDTTLTIYAEVTVKFSPRILSNSTCEELENWTCVCISEEFPLPTITWPLLKNHTTNVSNHEVNCVSVEFISSNCSDNLLQKFFTIVQQPQVIIAFLTGILLSATMCCLVRTCHRPKQKRSGNVAETLEMVTTQEDPLIDAGEAVENDGTHDQEAAEGGAVAAGLSDPEGDLEPKEVEYSNIDFFVLKKNSPSDKTQETTETEYAEIKKGDKEESQDNGGEGGEMFEGNEEEEVITGEETETKQCMSANEVEGVEDVAVYSTVNEVMDEI